MPSKSVKSENEEVSPATGLQRSREDLIAALEEVRKRPLIAYITSTRAGLSGDMSHDAVSVIYEHLCQMELPSRDKAKLDLFLHTDGGDATVPWRLINLLREYATEITLLVPHHAYSAGTLTALGADKVIMHPMGVLGPTDTSVTGQFNPRARSGRLLPIQVEDVRSYVEWVREDVGIRHEDELVTAVGYLAGDDRVHPLALGNVKRSVLQSRLMGEKLLSRRTDSSMPKHDIEEIIETLAAKLFFHGHPINRREAREDLNLSWVADASSEEAVAMWNLYRSYETEMQLVDDFEPMSEAVRKLGRLPDRPNHPTSGAANPNVESVDLDPLQMSWVETRSMAHCVTEDWTVNLVRNADGDLESSWIVRRSGWNQV